MKKLAWRDPLLFLAYPFANWAIIALADVIWQPVAGLRFAYAILLPVRWWLPLWLWAELGFHMIDAIRVGYWHSTWSTPPANWVVFFLTCSFAPFLLRIRGRVSTATIVDWMWLIAAMLFTGLANAVRLTLMPDWWAEGIPKAQLFWQVLLGDINGMVVAVPLILALASPKRWLLQWPQWRRELPPALILQCTFVVLPWSLGIKPSFYLTAGLMLPVAVWLAFRGGWRGAAFGLSSGSALVVLSGRLQGDLDATRDSQILLIVTGLILLLLGVAVDSLRNRERELEQRNNELTDLALKLRDTARRNQSQADDLRRWITSEVHDEVGQNLTALQLQIRLAENDAGQTEKFVPMRQIVEQMRRSVSKLLSQLRPVGIDEFGLRRTLAEGSVAELLGLAGVQYRLRIDGDASVLESLSDEAQVSLYRIVQETATNTLRYAQGTKFSVHFRIRQTAGGVRIVLRCADDGKGMVENHNRPNALGLEGINDRVLSLGGKMRLKSNNSGTRILVAMTLSLQSQLQ